MNSRSNSLSTLLGVAAAISVPEAEPGMRTAPRKYGHSGQFKKTIEIRRRQNKAARAQRKRNR